jgi:hypothetical protein
VITIVPGVGGMDEGQPANHANPLIPCDKEGRCPVPRRTVPAATMGRPPVRSPDTRGDQAGPAAAHLLITIAGWRGQHRRAGRCGWTAPDRFSRCWLPRARRTWHNSPVLDRRVGIKARQFLIKVIAAAAVAFVASCTALTGASAATGHVRTRERSLSTPHVAGAQVSSRGPANSVLAAGPHSASAWSPPAAPHVQAARNPRIQQLQRYRTLALLVIAVTCLTALIILRVRQRRAVAAGLAPRRKMRRSSASSPQEARAANGRHAVAGPAGFGHVPTGWPDFTRLATRRRGIPGPAVGRSASAPHRIGDPVVDEFGPGSPPVESTALDRAPMGEADAASGPRAWDVLPDALQSWGFEPRDNGIRKAPPGPPWGPAEKPSGELPWASTSPAWADDAGKVLPRRLPDPDHVTDPEDITDVLPAEPRDEPSR